VRSRFKPTVRQLQDEEPAQWFERISRVSPHSGRYHCAADSALRREARSASFGDGEHHAEIVRIRAVVAKRCAQKALKRVSHLNGIVPLTATPLRRRTSIPFMQCW
jgi:hypothetical protein